MQRRRAHLQSRKQLPAFGRQLLNLRLQGAVPARHTGLGCSVMVCLDSWEWGRSQLWYRLVITLEQDPAELDFSMCAGLHTILVSSSARSPIARRDVAIRRLLAAQVASLRVVDMAEPSLGFFVKTEARGIERLEYA